MILKIKPKRVSIFIAQGRYSAAQVRDLTGADVVINGGLYDMSTQRPNCHLRINDVDYASDGYNYTGYGWHEGKADLTPTESKNKVTANNYICCSWMITKGKPDKMIYAPATGGSRGNTAIGRLADGSIVVGVHADTGAERITPEELQGEMLSLGCIDAMRLDGGGSSQLASEVGSIAVSRKVHNYICIWGEASKIVPTTGSDKSMKIYLSPSSQPANLYAYGSTNEQAECRKIAFAAQTALQRCGFDCIVGDAELDFTGRTIESNKWGADIHVPIHTNAGGGRGPIVYIYSNTSARKALAQPVYDELNAIVPVKSNYGVEANPSLHEVKNSNAKCVYIEAAFHDNAAEAEWIIGHTTDIGEAICKGICRGTNTAYVAPDQSTAPPASEVLKTPKDKALEALNTLAAFINAC